MSLEVDIALSQGDFDLQLRFSAPAGSVVALVGPNGAGKSTTLAAIAGLVPLSGGEVILGERVLERVATGVRVPPQGRGAGVLFQGLALFEHLDALDNVGYGLRSRGESKRAAREAAQLWLDRLDVGALGTRRPGSLSGGEAQRVALARALILEPELLLLDEPMASLDAAVALVAREVLVELLSAFEGVSLLVTHDLSDALELADQVVVIEAGRLVQQGPPAEVFAVPATAHLRAMVQRLLPSRGS